MIGLDTNGIPFTVLKNLSMKQTELIPAVLTQESWRPEMVLTKETSHKFASVAVPDMAFTIRELLERHRAGILTDTEITRQGMFYDDQDYDSPDVEKLGMADLVDQAEYILSVKRKLAFATERAEKWQAARQAAEKEAELVSQKASSTPLSSEASEVLKQPKASKEKGS